LIFAASGGVQAAINQLPADAKASREKLTQSMQWLSDAMQTGRQLLTEIYPPELTGSLWVRAAKDTVDRLFGQSETNVSWNIDDGCEQISIRLAVTAYRIVVEAIRNAIRHGQAGKIDVEATRRGDQIVIVIRDDGPGFNPSEVPQDRFGIRSMTGRATLVGGSLQVESKPGGPTAVTFTVDC
jgi:signal transduction histidine kinase